MFGEILVFFAIFCGAGVLGETKPLLKLRFVSPEITVSVCGASYTIKSTCFPVIFEEEVNQIPSLSIFPPQGQELPGMSADILRSKPQVMIEDYDTVAETRSPWPVGTYCILMGNVAARPSFADATNPYVYWLVCDIPGTAIEKGRELIPYDFTTLTSEEEVLSIWMFRVDNPGADYDMSRFTSQDCGTADRCLFNIANFVSTNGLTELYNGVIAVQHGIWTAKHALDMGLTLEPPVCELITGITTTDAADLPDDGFRDVCNKLPVCKTSSRGNSDTRHAATSWGMNYIHRQNSGVRTC